MWEAAHMDLDFYLTSCWDLNKLFISFSVSSLVSGDDRIVIYQLPQALSD